MAAQFAITSVVLSLASSAALAQPSPAQPLWEIGALGIAVSQQAYPGAYEQVSRALLVPTVVYRGKYLRAGEGGASIRAIKTPVFEFDIGFAGAFGSGNRDIAIRRGMSRLGSMVEFGPRLKWNLAALGDGARLRAEFPVRGVFDLSNSFDAKGIAFEPELQYDVRNATGWSYSASVGALAGTRRLNQTFYGVAPIHANALRPAYAASGGLIALRLGAGISRALSPDWRLFLFGRIDDVHLGANQDSPLVQRKTGGSLGFGLAYTLTRSATTAHD